MLIYDQAEIYLGASSQASVHIVSLGDNRLQ